MALDEEIATARAELEAAHAEVMKSLGDVWVRTEAVRTSKPTDNVHDLLEELEQAVKKARTGGILGSGSKSQRRALEKLADLTAEKEV